jgi:hypothetical protein
LRLPRANRKVRSWQAGDRENVLSERSESKDEAVALGQRGLKQGSNRGAAGRRGRINF